jgi:uncharacterized protein (TIGR02145 family)
LKNKKMNKFIAILALLNICHFTMGQPKLEIDGAIEIGNSSNSTPGPGSLRWTGTDFEAYTGLFWQSLTRNQVIAASSVGQGQKMVIAGAIKLSASNESNPQPGTIRWSGGDFEGWNGVFWVSLTGNKLIDIDGNSYKTVVIGNQEWMMENLRTSRYNNGDQIPNDVSNSAWAALNTGAYCWYDNDKNTYEYTYGKLYNWFAVVDGRKLCPVGWHVPTESEWMTLITLYGGELVAGGKLKEVGTTHWSSPNTGATNQSGFTGIPGSGRSFNGSFLTSSLGVGNLGFWWTRSLDGTLDAFARALYSTSESVGSFLEDRRGGLSVRCLKD